MGAVILADTLAQACGDDPGVACRNVYEWTGNAALAEVANWLVDVPLRIVLILLVAWVATRIARRIIRRTARRLATSADEGALGKVGQKAVVGAAAPDPVRVYARMGALENVLGSVVSTVIWVIAGLVALGELNINLAPLIAGAGIAGVALGFGAQQVVRDYLSGVFIVSEDQFGPGDTIDLQDVSGTVEAVSLRSTKAARCRRRALDGGQRRDPQGGQRHQGVVPLQARRLRGLRAGPPSGHGCRPGGGRRPGRREWAMTCSSPPRCGGSSTWRPTGSRSAWWSRSVPAGSTR